MDGVGNVPSESADNIYPVFLVLVETLVLEDSFARQRIVSASEEEEGFKP